MIGDRTVGIRAVLRAIFGTNTETRLASMRHRDELAKNIDEMVATTERMKAIARPAENIDEVLKQVTGSR